ncbi:MAG TPA: tetratricopeptide repeat protein [Isosphaeraceae bacterium]|jgi:tetratricopeptide (TPR) repeat protein|nr:tetratricopeptide repeat protein [Isosphaeraceae bacterium]
MSTISVRIDDSFRWDVDGKGVFGPLGLTAESRRQCDALGIQFLELFEQKGLRPITSPDSLRAAGRIMAEVWLDPARPALAGPLKSSGPHELVIESNDPAVLNLPWELIELAPDLPIGCDAAWSVYRRLPDGPRGDGTPRPGPFRILFVAAAPTDQDSLDYEREEDAILKVAAGVPGVILHFAETGGVEELTRLIARCRPHVLHFSGHGVVDEDGHGCLAFEDERGRTELRRAEDFVAEALRGSPVRMVFLNACQTSRAAVAGLCQTLVGAGVPMALGWAGSVADDLATDFATEFYRRLIDGESASAAAAHARRVTRKKGEHRRNEETSQDATFALPQLYSSTTGSALLDREKTEPYDGPRTEYTLLSEGIKGLSEGFIGRRREVQRLLPALRTGEKTVAVLTGLGGTGKSTLATRLANRLEADGFRVVAVRVKEGMTPAEAGLDARSSLSGTLAAMLLAEGREDLYQLWTRESLPWKHRVRAVVDRLTDLRLLLVLDNLEEAMDLKSRRLAHDELSEFLQALSTGLRRGSKGGQIGSRAILTSRLLPAETPDSSPLVLHEPLSEFLERDFLKFLRGDDAVEDRIGRGDLNRDMLMSLYKEVGGTPRFLGQLRTLLRTADAEKLLEELEGGSQGLVADAREHYLESILVGRLFAALSPEAQAMASRLAVSVLPLPADGAASIAECDEPAARLRLEEANAYGVVQRFDEPDLPPLYHPPGLLRSWLSEPSRLPEATARTVHARLAAFWRSSYEADRESALRVSIETELAVCRDHAHLGGDGTTFQWATVRLANRLSRRSEWSMASTLLEQIPENEREAAAWHALASIDLDRGDYGAAAEKFATALTMLQAIGDRAGEAATWHNLATIDLNRGDYGAAAEKFATALAMRQAIGDRAGEAATWHQLATIDVHRGDYGAAAEKFDRSLEIMRAIGDRAGEAATWHQLASIDLNRGDYGAAAEKFATALARRQAIGDRAGEAATLYQLGLLARARGQGENGVRLVATCWLIDQAIGHGDAESDLRNLSAFCQELGYDQARYDTMMAEVVAAYQADRCRSLVEQVTKPT